jgi:hypothetical protein
MEQLGNLLTAMIAVIVGGSSDLLGGDPPPEPSLIEKLAASYYVLPPDISKALRRPREDLARDRFETRLCLK